MLHSYIDTSSKYLTVGCLLLHIIVGGNEPRLVAAATKQLNELPFYHSFWNRSTKPSLVRKTHHER